MRVPLLLLAALALPGSASAQEASPLFRLLDKDGDGYLDRAELRSEAAQAHSWMAFDRDNDERFSPAEFEPVQQAAVPFKPEPVEVVDPLSAALQGALSARRLIGAEVVEPDGEPIGKVQDILLNAAGAVTGLIVDPGLFPLDADPFRLPWHDARISALGEQVVAPAPSATAGVSGVTEPPLPMLGEWRATQFFDDVVQLERGRRYAEVADLIIAPWGEVKAIVVEDGARDGQRGLYAYPWNTRPFDVPHDRSHIRNLRPFDYHAFQIAPPGRADVTGDR